jgi:hypothetical protein
MERLGRRFTGATGGRYLIAEVNGPHSRLVLVHNRPLRSAEQLSVYKEN